MNNYQELNLPFNPIKSNILEDVLNSINYDDFSAICHTYLSRDCFNDTTLEVYDSLSLEIELGSIISRKPHEGRLVHRDVIANITDHKNPVVSIAGLNYLLKGPSSIMEWYDTTEQEKTEKVYMNVVPAINNFGRENLTDRMLAGYKYIDSSASSYKKIDELRLVYPTLVNTSKGHLAVNPGLQVRHILTVRFKNNPTFEELKIKFGEYNIR